MTAATSCAWTSRRLSGCATSVWTAPSDAIGRAGACARRSDPADPRRGAGGLRTSSASAISPGSPGGPRIWCPTTLRALARGWARREAVVRARWCSIGSRERGRALLDAVLAAEQIARAREHLRVLELRPRRRRPLAPRIDEPTYRRLAKRARALSWLSLAWMTVEGAVAIAAGAAASSIALIGFGLDSAIEGFASVIIVWRFTGHRMFSAARRAACAEARGPAVLPAGAICRGRVASCA